MDKKRFEHTRYDDGTESIYDTVKDEYYFNTTDFDDICKLLNELSEKPH